MRAILVDTRKYKRFKKGGMNGAVITLSSDEFHKLMTRGPDQFDEMKPTSVSFVDYKSSSGTCALDMSSCRSNIPAIRSATMRYLPIDTVLLANGVKGDKELVSNGFKDERGDGAWKYRHVDRGIVDSSNVPSGDYKLSDAAFEYLKTLPYRGVEKAGTKQKEIAGSLMSCNDDTGTELCIIPGTEIGSHMKVSIPGSAFTYHSHPEDAYTKRGVDIGFPSDTDYQTFSRNQRMKAHYVSTVEGLYHIHSRADDQEEFDRVLRSSVATDKTNGMTPQEHADSMTELGFFTVTFIPW